MPDSIAGELLYRNVPPSYFDADADQLNPAVVWPGSKDEGQLSSDRSDIWTAEQSYEFRTETVGRESCGVVALSSDELRTDYAIETIADPLQKGVDDAAGDNPAHALSDFNHLLSSGRAERARLREAILSKALANGWVHKPA